MDSFAAKMRRKRPRRHVSTSKKFYDRAAWRKTRAYVLSQAPLCADPFGVHKKEHEVTAASEVDHIVPRSERPDLELDIDNLQPLCKSCHSRKTMTDMRGR